MAKYISIRCFHDGKITGVYGDVFDEHCEEEEEEQSDTIHPFVCRTLRAFSVDYIPFPLLQTYVFDDDYLVSIRNWKFLQERSVVYVCSKVEKDKLQKFLRRKGEKEKRDDVTSKIEASGKQESGTKGRMSTAAPSSQRVCMGKNANERLQYHLKHKDDNDYSKYVSHSSATFPQHYDIK